MYIEKVCLAIKMVTVASNAPGAGDQGVALVFYFFQNRARPVAFFAFGSTFFGYALDVSKSMYQIRAPNSERPKITRNKVITGRPSAWTERSAVGVRIGASHSKAMMDVVECRVTLEAAKERRRDGNHEKRCVVERSCN
jgi:hypothetical protein